MNLDNKKRIKFGSESWRKDVQQYTTAIVVMREDTVALTSDITLHQYPTLNCQMGSIGSFQNIITSSSVKPETYPEILAEIDQVMQKNLLLIDINQAFMPKLDFFKKYIKESWPYTSTNGSKMQISLLNMKAFRDNQYKL